MATAIAIERGSMSAVAADAIAIGNITTAAALLVTSSVRTAVASTTPNTTPELPTPSNAPVSPSAIC